MSLFKNLKMGEKTKMQIRGEFLQHFQSSLLLEPQRYSRHHVERNYLGVKLRQHNFDFQQPGADPTRRCG
jgi:hypothetical protein